MGRTPKARQTILDSARHIVREHGAGKLTYEELVQQSGVTRGGITYHFPTKEALLRALIESDIEQWCELEQQLKPKGADPETAELVAFIRGHTERNEDHRRFVTGMLSAVTLDHSLLDPVREFTKRRREGVNWDDAQLRQHLLRMAAEGLFWSEIFGCEELQPQVRKRLVALMEQLAVEWTASTSATDPG
jgi:AcrR family transcriptional regulator